jgi:uncharacterized membrane protein YjjB (DUF3815 family)
MGHTGSKQRKAEPEQRPRQSALWAVFIGVVGLMTTFVVVATFWSDESGVAALAAVASSIAAILSGYFSIQYTQGTDRRRR